MPELQACINSSALEILGTRNLCNTAQVPVAMTPFVLLSPCAGGPTGLSAFACGVHMCCCHTRSYRMNCEGRPGQLAIGWRQVVKGRDDSIFYRLLILS